MSSQANAVSDLERAEHINTGNGTGLKRVALFTENNGTYPTVSPQYPIPIDGDSIYAKDINASLSNIGNFSGVVTDLFDDLTSTITDVTANNPKTLDIKLNRPVDTGTFRICASTGNFSNVKITLKDRAGNVVTTIDDSANNTKYSGNQYDTSPDYAWCNIVIEFYTADAVTLDFISIQKTQHVFSQLQAISETTGSLESITSDDGMLNMLVRLRDATGNTKINPARSDYQDRLAKYRIADKDDDAEPNYFGFTDDVGNYYILKENASTYRYSTGSSGYTTAWTNRASESYDYLYNVTIY